MTTHHLKCEARFFRAVSNYSKTFEVRRDDRDPPFQVDDELVLHEARGENPDWVMTVRVTYVLRHEDLPEGVPEGWVVMGIKVLMT